jgi:hypothetical protein
LWCGASGLATTKKENNKRQLGCGHSFKNQTDSLVGPEKTGTSDLAGLLRKN